MDMAQTFISLFLIISSTAYIPKNSINENYILKEFEIEEKKEYYTFNFFDTLTNDNQVLYIENNYDLIGTYDINYGDNHINIPIEYLYLKNEFKIIHYYKNGSYIYYFTYLSTENNKFEQIKNYYYINNIMNRLNDLIAYKDDDYIYIHETSNYFTIVNYHFYINDVIKFSISNVLFTNSITYMMVPDDLIDCDFEKEENYYIIPVHIEYTNGKFSLNMNQRLFYNYQFNQLCSNNKSGTIELNKNEIYIRKSLDKTNYNVKFRICKNEQIKSNLEYNLTFNITNSIQYPSDIFKYSL